MPIKCTLIPNEPILKIGTHIGCDSSMGQIHAKGFCSASLRREATCGKVSERRNLRISLRRSKVAGIPVANLGRFVHYHEQYVYKFSDTMVGIIK